MLIQDMNHDKPNTFPTYSSFEKHNKHCTFANYIYVNVAFIILNGNSEVREHEFSSTIHGIQFCLDKSLDLDQFMLYKEGILEIKYQQSTLSTCEFDSCILVEASYMNRSKFLLASVVGVDDGENCWYLRQVI